MRILFLPNHLSTGGMPSFLCKRIEVLKELDHDIYVVEHNYYGEWFVVHRNRIKEMVGDKFYTYRSKDIFLKLIEHEKIDIVHLDEMPELMNNDDLFNSLYSNNRTYRIVETCHNSTFNPDTQKRYHPDLYLFCTPYHENVFANMDSQYYTIEYPIDNKMAPEKKFEKRVKLGLDPLKKHVINVGLWTPGKNQGEMLEIAKQYPDMMFHSIGNQAGNFAEYWEPLMKDVPSNVKIWGERNDVSDFMIAADIFMFNSKLELSPLVLREAICYGLPIVARNLPVYCGVYDEFIKPLDTDLRTLKKNYTIPLDKSTENFGLYHQTAYEKILEKPILKQKVRIINHYIDNPYLEILGVSDSNFEVLFYEESGKCAYMQNIKSNHWVKLKKQYYHKWRAEVWQDGETIYNETLNLEGKRVYIAFESKSLGDSIAWMPYVEEFRKKHNCQVICSTFWNQLFDYPEIEFVEPGNTIHNIYALYRIGYFSSLDKIPVNPQTIPLQKVATAILGLDFVELAPILAYKPEVPNLGRYVTISTNSTMECKFWEKSSWQTLINWLVLSQGYEVYNVSKEPNLFDNCTQIATPSIESKMDWIAGASFHISLSSGLGWLAYAMGKHVVMIANFTEEWNEFQNNVTRITNKEVCHGCWNDANIKLDPHWLFCPRNKNFECQKSITPEMVINKIKQII